MTTGPFAVRSESLTGLPSVPFSVKSGAFCPTSSAPAALASTAPARSASDTAIADRRSFIDRLLSKVGWAWRAPYTLTPSRRGTNRRFRGWRQRRLLRPDRALAAADPQADRGLARRRQRRPD